VVEAEGHLIDSQLMNAMFDTVVRHDAAFDVLEFRIGRTNDEPSFVSMRVTAKAPPALTEVLEELIALGCRVARAEDAHLVAADRDGCAPEDFYSTTNQRTLVRRHGQWVEVRNQRMDALIVVRNSSAICRRLRDIKAGDSIVTGMKGIRVVPEAKERDRLAFAFMSSDISSERQVETAVGQTAALMQQARADGKKIVAVSGPVWFILAVVTHSLAWFTIVG